MRLAVTRRRSPAWATVPSTMRSTFNSRAISRTGFLVLRCWLTEVRAMTRSTRLTQAGDQRFGHPVAQVLLVRAVRKAFKRQHGDRLKCGLAAKQMPAPLEPGEIHNKNKHHRTRDEHRAPAADPWRNLLFIGSRGWRHETDFGLEEESPPGDRLNDLLRIVRQGLSDLGDALGNGFVGDRDVSPHRLHEFLASDQASLGLDEIPQHLVGLGADFDLASPAEQAFGCRIEREVEKRVPTSALCRILDALGLSGKLSKTLRSALFSMHIGKAERPRSTTWGGKE